MTGHSHTGEGKEFGLQVMQKLNDKCAEWKAAENIDYSVYGTLSVEFILYTIHSSSPSFIILR